MTSRISWFAPFVFLASAFPTSTFATTITVDDSGGADHVSIVDAIAAAGDGDVILVRAGTYAGFAIVGKSLVVRADDGGGVLIEGGVTITALGAAQQVELAGLSVHATHFGGEPALLASANQGVVKLRSCTLRGANGTDDAWPPYHSRGTPALDCRETAEITIQSSTLVGGSGDLYLARSSPAVRALASALTVRDSTFTGGRGSDVQPQPIEAGSGGEGVDLQTSHLRIAHSTVRGGDGGTAGAEEVFLIGYVCFEPGHGGDAVRASAKSSVLAHDTEFVAGARGAYECEMPAGSPYGYDMPPPHGQTIVGGTIEPLFVMPFCFGYEAACPCGNQGFGRAGCATSSTHGARLVSNGTPSVAQDDLRFTARDLPTNSTALLFQGSTALGQAGVGATFGDGAKCVGGAVIRLATRTATAGVVPFGQAVGDAPFSLRGAIPAHGGVRYYQAWFRDTTSFCTSAPFNLSDALEVVWTP